MRNIYPLDNGQQARYEIMCFNRLKHESPTECQAASDRNKSNAEIAVTQENRDI